MSVLCLVDVELCVEVVVECEVMVIDEKMLVMKDM